MRTSEPRAQPMRQDEQVPSTRTRSSSQHEETSSKQVLQQVVAALLTAMVLGIIALFRDHVRPGFQAALVVLAGCLAIVTWLLRVGQRWRHRRLLLRLATGLGVATAVLIVMALVVGRPEPASLSWYGLDEKDIKVDVEALSADETLLVPIRLAARNLADVPLKNVTVEIEYPSGYAVEPKGKQRLDPERRTLVYEHDLDDLKVDGGAVFLPDSSLDQIAFRTDVRTSFGLSFSAEDMPIDFATQVITYTSGDEGSEVPLPTLPIPLQVTLFSDGRPVASSDLSITVPGVLQFGRQLPQRPTPISAEKLSRWSQVTDGPQRWEMEGLVAKGENEKIPVQYRSGIQGGSRYQVIAVRGIPRRVIVDEDGNGTRDYELNDVDADGTLELAAEYEPDSVSLYPWTQEMFE